MDLKLILEMANECLAIKPERFDGNKNGYDKAIVGLTDNGQLVYSKEIMIKITMNVNKNLTKEDAYSFLEFTTFNTYLGEQTPIYVNTY